MNNWASYSAAFSVCRTDYIRVHLSRQFGWASTRMRSSLEEWLNDIEDHHNGNQASQAKQWKTCDGKVQGELVRRKWSFQTRLKGFPPSKSGMILLLPPHILAAKVSLSVGIMGMLVIWVRPTGLTLTKPALTFPTLESLWQRAGALLKLKPHSATRIHVPSSLTLPQFFMW